MNPSVVIKSELKVALGRLGLLRTTGWKRETHRLRGRRKRCAWKQKRGKQAGLQARLKATNRPALPTLFLANIRSLDNKMDLMRLQMSIYKEMRNCCQLLLTETWLNNHIRLPD